MILVRDLIGSLSLVELAWVLSALSGITLSLLNGYESVLDFHALEGKRNGRRRIAIGCIRREVVRGVVNTIFLGVGIVAALTPANPNATALGVAVSLSLLIASVAYNLNSALDRADRIYLLNHGLQARDEQGRFVKED